VRSRLGGASFGHRVFAVEGGLNAGLAFSDVIEHLDVP
jgi:hypothetical protein